MASGITFATRWGMPEASVRLVSDEPTVMWRMKRADGLSSHGAIDRRPDGTFIFMWFINGHPLGYRDCADWTSAIRWSDQMQSQNWAVGWRVTPEYDDPPE